MASTTAPLALSLSLPSDTGLLPDGITRRNTVDVNILGLNVLGGPITIFDDRNGNGGIDAGEVLARIPNSLLATARVTLSEGSHSLRAVQTSPGLLGSSVVTTSLPLTVQVDNTAPTIVSVTQLNFPDPLGLLDLTGLLRYEVRFSEAVSGLTANLFQATGTLPGIHLVTLIPDLLDASRYIVSVGLGLDGISPDQRNGTLGLALNPANLTGVVDIAGNALRGADFALLAPVNIGPARETATADLNSDGLGDAAFLVNDTVVVTRGTDTGSFGPTQAYGVAAGQNTIAIGDVTGDGRADIVTAGGGRIQVLSQNPDGSFTLADRATPGAQRALLADVDGDGNLDIATANTAANTLTILSNDGRGTFAAGATVALDARPDSFVSGDFNGDGRVDFAALADGGTTLAVLTQAATGGGFTRSTIAVPTGSGALAAGDLNGDGRAELVSGGTGGTIEVRGITAGGAVTTLTLQAGSVPTEIRIGDVDSDGRQDILYAGADGNVRVARGDGAGHFSAPVILETQAGLTALALLDVNGDGRQDLALASGTTGTLQVGTGIPLGGVVGSLYNIVAPAPVHTVTAAAVAGDNIVNIAEAAGGRVTVTGSLDGPLAANETLAVRIGGITTPLADAAIVTANGQTTFTAAVAAPMASGEIGFLVQRADGAASTPLVQAFGVDLIAPTLASVTSADGPVTKDAVIDFTVTFSEPVTGLTAANFGITGTAATGLVPVVTPIDGGRSYAVSVSAPGAEGTLGLTFVPTGLADAAGNPVPGGVVPVAIGPVLTLDHLPPVLTLAPIGGDGILSAAELTAGATVSGTVLGLPDGASVAVSFTDAAGVAILAQTATVTGGQFSLPLAPARLPDGAYVVSVSAVDAAGNVAAPAVANLLLDTQVDGGTPFAISLGNGNTVGPAGAAAVPLTVSGLDAGTTASITFTDGSNTVVATAGANGPLPVNLSGLDGPVTSTVRIFDTAGNAATGTGPSLTIDKIAPVGSAVPSLAQNPGTVSFDVAFAEAVTNADVTDFRVAVTGSALGEVVSAVANGTGGYTVTVGNLSGEGTVGLALSGTSDIADAAGNRATLSTGATVAVDRVPPPVPAITGLLDDLGAPVGFSTRDSTPTLAGTAEANATVTVSYEAGGTTQTLTAQADAAGAWSVTSPVLPTGSHAFTATATDAAGNVSLPSAPRLVTVDTTPGIPFTLAVDFGDGLVNATEARAVGYVLTDLPSGATLDVSFTDGTGAPVTVRLDAGGGTLDLSGLDGRVTSELTYTPFGGGARPLLGPGATFDVTAPAIPGILGFAQPGQAPSPVTNDPTPLLVGNGEPGSVVTVLVNGITLTAEVGGDGTWRVPVPVEAALGEGDLSLTATARDLAGNVSQPCGPVTVTLDVTADAPDAVDVRFDVPAGRALNADEAGHLTALVSGIDADATAVLTLTGPNGSVATPIVNGQVTVPDLSGLGGSVVATVLVTDAAGNAATLPLPNLAIDAIAPAATIVADPAALPGAASVTFLVTFPEAVTGLDPADFKVVHTGTAAGTISGAVATADGYVVTVSGITGSGSVSLDLAGDPTVTDLVGNKAVPGNLGAHLVNVPPVVAPADLPVILSITEDTGVAGDFVTRDGDPVVSGTAQPLGTVTLSYAVAGGSTATLVTQADAAGNWSVPLPVLGDGTYALSATLTDASGTVLGVSPTLSLAIDRVADAGTPVALAVNATANGAVDATEAMAVSYAVTGLDAGSTAVVRFTDGDLVRQATVAADGTFMIDLTGLDGNVTSSVTVTDLAGNFGTAAGNTIRVDTDVTAVPSPGGLAVASDTGIKGDGITSAVTPVLTGSAEAGASVSVVLAGPSGPVTLVTAADANGTWTVTAPALADATYAVTATANGASGLPSAASQPFSLVIDTTADQAPLVALQLASPDTKLGAAEATGVSFTLSGLDAGSSGTVTFSDGTRAVDVAVAANGTYTADLSALSGTVTASGLIADAAGNVATPVLALPPGLSVDTVAPTGTAVADLSGGDAVPSFSYQVTFSEPVDGVGAGDFALVGTPGVSGQIASVTGSGGSYVVTVAGIQGSGTLTLGLAQGSDIADAAGNLATLAPAARDVTGVLPVQPVILAFGDDTGTPGDSVTADRSPTLTGIGQPDGVVTIEYATTDGPRTASATVSASGTWSVTVPDLADGAYAFQARLVDADGNAVGVSAPLTLTIDTTADALPAATLTVGASQDGVLNATEAASAGFVVAGLDPGTTGTAILTAGGASVSVAVTGNGGYAADLSGLNGPVTTSLVLSDAAGNAATLTGTGPVLDTIAPAGTATPDGSPASATSFTYLVGFPEAVANVTAGDFALTSSQGATGRVSGVEAVAGGYLVTVSDVSGTGSLTLGLAQGSDITDLAGNRATLSASPHAVSVGGIPSPVAPAITGFGDDTGTPGDGITSDATPTLGGTGSPGGTVTVAYAVAGVPTSVTGQVDGLGRWSVEVPSLADGTYAFTASVTDAAGRPTGTSAPLSLTIDATAPGVPSFDVLAPTTDTTPTLTGTAEPGTTVTIVGNGTPLGSALVGADGHFTFTPTAPLAGGDNVLTASAADAAGNVGAGSTPVTLVIVPTPGTGDTTPPPAPVLDAHAPTNDTTPVITGSAEAGSTVIVSNGATQVGSAVAGPDGHFSVTATTLPEGTASLTAVAVDSAGNRSPASAPTALVIDTTADAGADATLTVDPTGDHRINATEAGAVAYTIAGLDPGAVGRVTFTDATHGMTSMDVGNGTYNADLSGFSGAVTSVLTIQDAAANTTTRDGTLVTVDTVAPTGTATPSPQGGSGATTFTYAVAFSEPVTNVTANDFVVTGTGGASGRVGAVAANGTGYLVTVTDVAGTGSLSLGLAATADLADASGNLATLSATPRAVTVGGTPQPAPTLITGFGDDTGIQGDGITSDPTPTLSGTAAAGGTVTVAYVEAGALKSVSAPVDGTGAWTVAIPALSDGSYSFTASAVTAGGTSAGTSGPLTLTIDTVADAVPLVSLTVDGPAGGTLTPAQAAAVTFMVAGLDAGSAAAVTFTDGSHTVRVDAGADGSYRADLSGLTGPVTSSFVVSDAAGNIAGGTGNGVVIGQTGTSPGDPPPTGGVPPSGGTAPGQGTPPVAAPVVTGLQPDTGIPGDGITSDPSPTLTGTGTPGGTVTVTYGDASGSQSVTAPVGSDGAWTVKLPTLPDGAYDVVATGRDAAGTATPAGQPFRVVVDTLADGGTPVALAVEPTVDGVVNAVEAIDTAYRVTGLDAGSVAAVTFTDGVHTVTTQVTADGRHTVDLTGLNGPVTSTILATDAAGNPAQAAGNTVTLDTVGPAAPVVTGFTEDTGLVGNATTADPTPTLVGTAEAGSVVSIAYDTQQGPRTGTAVTGPDGHWSLDLPSLAEGHYAFVASATDAAGNYGQASAAFGLTIDPRDVGTVGGGSATDGGGTGANLAPHAVADTIATVTHAAAVTGNVLANDSDPNAGDVLHVTAVRFASGITVAVPTEGTVTVLGDHGTLHLAADGSYSYQAIGSSNLSTDVSVAEHFTYTVSDGKGLSAQAGLAVSLAGAAPPAEASFGFAFTEARVERLGETLVLTGPDGVQHDVGGIGSLHFADGSIQQNDGHALVDDVWYLAHNLDVWKAGVDADTHYETYGWHEGRDPNAYFSTQTYLAVNPDVAAAGVNPLEHYAQYGEHEGRSPSPDFSGEAYLAQYSDVAASGENALEHYLHYGQGEGRNVPDGKGSQGHIGAFDPAFYLAQNPDVAAVAAEAGPFTLSAPDYAFHHYVTYGADEGRAPNALFDPGFYLASNPDVAGSDLNPLLHYEEYGWREGRNPGPGFDTNAYLEHNPDVAAADIDPLQHYLDFGMKEGRLPV